MKTTLVAHLAMVGLLFGSTGADVLAQDSHDTQDEGGAPRPRLKLPRMRSAPAAPIAPRAPLASGLRSVGDTPKLGVMINVSDDGLVIAEVMDDSLAEAAGVQAGDMLLKMDGRSIDSVDDIREALAETRPGGTLGLTVVREGQGLVKLEADIPRPEPRVVQRAPGAMSPAPDGHQGGFLGVQLGEGDEDGVLVDGVVEQSAAWFAGLDEGDVLLKIGKTEVSSGQDVVGAIASLPPGTFVKITYERDGETQNARVRLGSRTPAPGALGSFFAPNAPGGGPGALRSGVPRNSPQALPNVRFFNSEDDDFPFAVDGPIGGAQSFTFDGDGGFWVSDDENGHGHDVFTFDGDDIQGMLQGIHKGHGNTFMLDLDDLEGLGELGDGSSLGITFENGVLSIDRDGEVQVIDLSDLEDLEQLHEIGEDDVHGVHLKTLKALPQKLMKRLHGADGDTRVEVHVKRSGDAVQPTIRQMSFTPGASPATIITTTTVGEGCCSEPAEVGSGCCDEVPETGDVN